MKKYTITQKENDELVEAMNTLTSENQKLRGFIDGMREQLIRGGVVSSLTSKDKLYLNTLLVNKLLEKEDDGTYKAVNDIGVIDKINDLMGKVNNS
jgi:hypothetical protein